MTEATSGVGRLRASVARGGTIGVVGAVSSTAGGFLLVFVAAHLLGPEGSGRIFAAIALFTVVINAAKLGADTSLVRFVSQRVARHQEWAVPELLRIAIPPTLVVSVVVTAVMAVGAPTVAGLLYTDGSSTSGTGLVRQLAWYVPPATLTLVLLGATRGFGTVSAFVGVEQIFKPLIRPLLVGAVVLAGGGGSLALGAWLVPVIVGFVISVLALRRQLRSVVPTAPATAEAVSAGEFWRFAVPRALSGFLEIIAPWTAVLLLSALSSSADAAIFTALSRVALAGTMVMVALRLALGPHISAAFSVGDRGAVAMLHQHSTVWAILASWPFFFSIAVFAHPVLTIFGGDFSDGSWALMSVAAGNLVNVAVGNAQTVLLMAGRSTWNLVDTASAVVTQVALGLLLIPPFGVTGAGIAYTAGIVVNNVTALLQVRNGMRIGVWSRSSTAACLLTAGVFGVTSLACRSLLGDTLPALVVAVLVATGLCAVVAIRRPQLLHLEESARILRGNLATPAPEGE